MKCLTVTEAASRLLVCDDTILRWLKAGTLEAYRPTPARVYIPIESIERFEREHTFVGEMPKGAA